MLPAARLTRHARRLTPAHWRAGEAWYPVAWAWAQRIGRKWGYSPDQIAGVIAALSPLCPWAQNLRVANMACFYHARHEDPPALSLCYANTLKAWRILDGEDPLTVLGGRKVTSFYLAILGADEPVIDTWAYRAAVGQDPPYTPTRKQYAALQDAFRKAAARVNVSPRTLQAAVWVSIRVA